MPTKFAAFVPRRARPAIKSPWPRIYAAALAIGILAPAAGYWVAALFLLH